MSDNEVLEICNKISSRTYWPSHIPLQTRLELVKAQLTLAWRLVERQKQQGGFVGSDAALAYYKGDSNGAAAMLRCIDEYSHGGPVNGANAGPCFDEAWALGILKKHEDVIKEITA